jgi:hypothetical protein
MDDNPYVSPSGNAPENEPSLPDVAMRPCSVCGGTDFLESKLISFGDVVLKANHFFGLAKPIRAIECQGCGRVELFAVDRARKRAT